MWRAIRLVVGWIGNLLLVIGLAGLALATWGRPELIKDVEAWEPVAWLMDLSTGTNVEDTYVAGEVEAGIRPITGVQIPSIDLSATAVPAPLVEVAQGVTWEVPPFRVGHGEGTAGAGQPGNAVLLGHVSSRGLGNVFQRLDRVKVGDLVQLSSEDEEFTYVVEEIRWVPRTDVSVVEPTERSAVTLLTCVGTWLPQLQDYSDRLIVRAFLQ